jgi:hypothetical protein
LAVTTQGNANHGWDSLRMAESGDAPLSSVKCCSICLKPMQSMPATFSRFLLKPHTRQCCLSCTRSAWTQLLKQVPSMASQLGLQVQNPPMRKALNVYTCHTHSSHIPHTHYTHPTLTPHTPHKLTPQTTHHTHSSHRPHTTHTHTTHTMMPMALSVYG